MILKSRKRTDDGQLSPVHLRNTLHNPKRTPSPALKPAQTILTTQETAEATHEACARLLAAILCKPVER